MAECVERDDRILLFGTGHSHLLAEEGHYAVGGLANVVPMLESSLMLHQSSILSGKLERIGGRRTAGIRAVSAASRRNDLHLFQQRGELRARRNGLVGKTTWTD